MRAVSSIDLVLLLRNPSAQDELGPALWAAFREVESFYNSDMRRAAFRRFFLSEQTPSEQVLELLRAGQDAATPQPLWHQAPPSLWEVNGSRQVRTYDARKINASVRDLLGDQLTGTPVIVTDQELTPPPDWRYILFENRVISLAPMDPKYWRTKDPRRVATIKHRARTTCLLNVGSLLGLGRCGNDHCFLYSNIDSVMRLDAMIKLGGEHNIVGLENRGFEVFSDEPQAVQPILDHPAQQGWFYER
jgi:hypothetical protein